MLVSMGWFMIGFVYPITPKIANLICNMEYDGSRADLFGRTPHMFEENHHFHRVGLPEKPQGATAFTCFKF